MDEFSFIFVSEKKKKKKRVPKHYEVGDSYTDKASGMLYTKTENGWKCSFDPDYTDCASDGCNEGGNTSDTRIKFFRKDKGSASPKTGKLYCCQTCMDGDEPEEE
jgi:hypothetical protein